MSYWAKTHLVHAAFESDGTIAISMTANATGSKTSCWSSNSSSSGSSSSTCDEFQGEFRTRQIDSDTATAMISRAKDMHGNAPPSSAAAWLRIMSNSLCTNARFGRMPRLCVFGCSQFLDHTTHYLACPVLYEALNAEFRINTGPAHFGEWLLRIDRLSVQKCMVAFGVADCMQHAYNMMSSGNKATLNEPITARRRFLTLRSAPMNNTIIDHISGIEWPQGRKRRRSQ